MIPALAILGTFSVVIFVHELGHFLVARLLGVRVEKFSLGMGPEMVGITRSGTRYCISWLFFLGGFVKLAGEEPEEQKAQPLPDEFLAQSWPRRSLILVAGVVMNLILASALFTAALWKADFKKEIPDIYGIQYSYHGANEGRTVWVADVISGSPAQSAGLIPRSEILSLDGKPVASAEEVRTHIQKNPRRNLNFALKDSRGKEYSVRVKPRMDLKLGKPLIGVSLREFVRISYDTPWQKALSGVFHTYDTIFFTVKVMGQLIKNAIALKSAEPLSESLAGPIGIAQVITYAAREGFFELLYLIALISANIGFINLLPIPLLDGGHLFFCILEGVSGVRLTPKRQALANAVGMSFLLALLLFATYSDIHRFVEGTWKFKEEKPAK